MKKRFQKLKRNIIIAGILTVCGCLSGCAAQKTDTKDNSNRKEERSNLSEEEVTIHIPGLEKEYRFVFAADLHIIVENEEINSENLTEVRERAEGLFRSQEGISSAELWEKLPAILDSYHADAVLLGGDMIDFASAGNVECLKKGIDNIKTDTMYVRADHDYGKWYGRLDKAEIKKLHRQIDADEEVSLIEYPDLCIMGINNNTSQISSKALERIKEIFSLGKPVIIVAHVPFSPLEDTSLAEQSKQAWQDRVLLWGKDCLYEPDHNTQEFMDMLYAHDTPVKAVLSGHLHFSWDGVLTENTHQHVFGPAFEGKIGIVTVKGTE